MDVELAFILATCAYTLKPSVRRFTMVLSMGSRWAQKITDIAHFTGLLTAGNADTAACTAEAAVSSARTVPLNRFALMVALLELNLLLLLLS